MKDRIEDKYILSLEEYFYLKEKIKTKFQKKYDDRIVNFLTIVKKVYFLG